jgi:asparagine synthase (glutamine-hydrolysing)
VRRFASKGDEQFLPWLNPEFVKRLNLRDRWATINAGTPPNHSARPEAYELVASPYWTANFEQFDPGNTRFPIELYEPFFDLRVLKFLLGLPALPWCSDKEILRRAARGILPEAVRLRKKSPLIADPITALLQRPESAWVDRFEMVPELHEYVLRDHIPKVFQTADAFTALVRLRPLSLNFWLQRRSIVSYKM